MSPVHLLFLFFTLSLPPSFFSLSSFLLSTSSSVLLSVSSSCSSFHLILFSPPPASLRFLILFTRHRISSLASSLTVFSPLLPHLPCLLSSSCYCQFLVPSVVDLTRCLFPTQASCWYVIFITDSFSLVYNFKYLIIEKIFDICMINPIIWIYIQRYWITFLLLSRLYKWSKWLMYNFL